MNEKGKKICPAGSRKFWHFLKTMDEKNKPFTGNKNQPEKMTFILVENSQCLLNKTYKSTDKNHLLGLWKDSLTWKTNKEDSCWLGMKKLSKYSMAMRILVIGIPNNYHFPLRVYCYIRTTLIIFSLCIYN